MASRSVCRSCTCCWGVRVPSPSRSGCPRRWPRVPTPVLFKGARVVDPASGRDEIGDVLVDGGVIASPRASSATVLDCEGLVLAPGLVDLHTHLRQPGR